ncbi:hypothetical protein [Streptomyces sp. NPDC056361]|uniref:hypothetical protein n=1 Tax=Streptomyces sp. NPDC056361 TaxID=3345795 RepID=UPI0035D7B0D9
MVIASFGFALGFDQETTRLMTRRPQPRGESVLTRPVPVTAGIGGLSATARRTRCRPCPPSTAGR